MKKTPSSHKAPNASFGVRHQMMHLRHYTPELILVIMKDKKEARIEKTIQKQLDRLKKPHIALALCVAPRDLKNLLTAVKLMDVKGLFIAGDYQKKPRMFADVIKQKGLINTVVLRGKKYHGFNIPTLSESVKIWTK